MSDQQQPIQDIIAKVQALDKAAPRWWTQFVAEDKRYRWRHGRWFIHDHRNKAEGHIEWSLFKSGPLGRVVGFQLGRNGSESDAGLDLHLGPLASFYGRISAPWLSWLRIDKDDDPEFWHYARHYGVKLGWAGSIIQIECGARDGYWGRSQPWWQEISLRPRHIWGKIRSDRVIEETGETVVPMPEGTYPATWERSHHERAHVRWPGTWLDRIHPAHQRSAYSLNIEGGIPKWGKGENSWDLGMDGTYGISGGFSTLEAAVGGLVESVLRSRKRYGGPHDLPRPMTVGEAGAWAASERANG